MTLLNDFHRFFSQPKEKEITLSGLRGSLLSMVTETIAGKEGCVLVVATESQVTELERDLALFSENRVFPYPGYEIPPYTALSPDQNTTAKRISTLFRIHEQKEPFSLVVSAEALMRKVLPPTALFNQAELVMASEECDQAELRDTLEKLGYEKAELVQSIGEYAVRGGIIDIFPPSFSQDSTHNGPIRLDFFGDTVESIRVFDPITQRSLVEIEEVILLPVQDIILSSPQENTTKILQRLKKHSEKGGWDPEKTKKLKARIADNIRFAGREFFLPLFYEETATLFDFLPDSAPVVFTAPEAIKNRINLVTERIENNYHAAVSENTPAFPPDQLFLLGEKMEQVIHRHPLINCSDFQKSPGQNFVFKATDHLLLKQEISIQRKKRGLLAPLSDQIRKWQNENDRVILCCRSDKRTKNLAEILDRYHHDIRVVTPPLGVDFISSEMKSTVLYLCSSPLSEGFSLLEEKLHFLSESELFGNMRLGSKTRSRYKKGEPVLFSELKEEDIVVHRDHGLAKYLGLVTMELQAVKNDYMLLEYRDGDKLYLPVDRLNLISRYEGLSDTKPRLDKLGSQSWRSTKAKVKEEVWKVATELLDLYAKREIKKGVRFSHPGKMYRELEESFPFDETPGQNRAIGETLDDLTSERVMDRLVCGDVGYGKTEVAVRAAFKVIEDGYQVAILVPTTVLAEQHAKTFADRLQDLPVTIGCLNRYRTSSTQKELIKASSTGQIDILIGTHRLLSKDVKFNKLGLLIVDEEHRFGVSHKEKIKQLRVEIDVLTLTATPIPRTLQMSLLGIRDLSIISSPPKQRLPVKTFVSEYDDLVIKEAVINELLRKGQVFIVHNRVRSIHRFAAKIQTLVPGAKIGVAHGQMKGNELEEIMVSFVNKEIDVLLSTTIIESGLDIPSANTIIIDRADRLGLADIYQLRGRVGRSSIQSFAYLLVPSFDSLSRESKQRLRTLIDYNELGGGFKLAMSDLQIRGGGNLLGVSQSGHIAAIGYDLYLDLLQKTVADIKQSRNNNASNKGYEDFDPEINLGLSAFIPDSYIANVSQRYLMYRRISALANAEQDADLINELEDRYGAIPSQTENLLRIIVIKRKLKTLRITRLEKGRDNMVFTFRDDTPVAPDKLLALLQKIQSRKKGSVAKLTPDGRFVITFNAIDQKAIFDTIEETIYTLSGLMDETK